MANQGVPRSVRLLFGSIQQRWPVLEPHPPPKIRDYGDIDYFFPCRLGTHDILNKATGEFNPNVVSQIRRSIPRDSLGTRSQDMRFQNFQWLMNKKLTCILMWLGVILLIIGVIALQIASFFYHTRHDILSTGVGCLSSGLCLLTVTMFTFLHAHLFIYDREVSSVQPMDQSLQDMRITGQTSSIIDEHDSKSLKSEPDIVRRSPIMVRHP